MGNNGGVYTWSQSAANNATFDNTVNWQEGQSPSSINDSGRAMMASVAKYRDDISGSIVTTGTSTAYIVSSNQQFDKLADFAGQVIAFTPHATNGAGPVTMTVDGFANLPLRSAPNTELLAGTLIQGTPYVAMFNNADGALYLHGFYGNPYNVPLGAGMDYWLPTAPNSSFAFPIGQAISRTTYAKLFAGMGTTYGSGDGSTTFNLPDKTGRVSAMQEASESRLTPSFFGGNSTVLGAVGGAESHTLTLGEIPGGITSAGTVTDNTGLTRLGSTTGSGITVFQWHWRRCTDMASGFARIKPHRHRGPHFFGHFYVQQHGRRRAPDGAAHHHLQLHPPDYLMNSILAMLRAIHRNPHVDQATRLRAGYLAIRMTT